MYWKVQGSRRFHFFCLRGIALWVFLWVWVWPSRIDTNNESFGMSPNFTWVSVRSFCGVGARSSDTYPSIWYPVGLARPFSAFSHMCFSKCKCYRAVLALPSVCSINCYSTGSHSLGGIQRMYKFVSTQGTWLWEDLQSSFCRKKQ